MKNKIIKIMILLALPLLLFTFAKTTVNARSWSGTTIIKKVWNDEDNKYQKRPTSIEVEIYYWDYIIDTITLTAENNWQQEYRLSDIEEITVKEKDLSIHYEATQPEECIITEDVVGECVITNTLKTTILNGTKTWVDEDNKNGKRPESIKVYLLQDGNVIAETTTDENKNWTYEFNAPKLNDSGEDAVYTIKEEEVAYYTSQISGTNITNTYNEGTLSEDSETNETENPNTKDNIIIIVSSIIVILTFTYTSYKQYNSLKN